MKISGNIPFISMGAALDLESSQGAVLEYVNERVAGRPDLLDDENPPTWVLLAENHRNHVKFMVNVIKLRHYGLLEKTLPWVYRTYMARGVKPAYFPFLFDTFKSAFEEVLEIHHARELTVLYDCLIDRHEHVLGSLDEGEADEGLFDTEWSMEAEEFLKALLGGDQGACLTMAEELVRDADTLKVFYLKVVAPCLYKVGALWQSKSITIADEHLASSIVSRVMVALYMKLSVVRPDKGRVIVTASVNEFHEIGSRMFADFLEMDGWDVVYLGADMPTEDLLSLLAMEKPFALCVSVAMSFNVDKVLELVSFIRGDEQFGDLRIVVGGYALQGDSALAEVLKDADLVTADIPEAIGRMKGWWQTK